ncbi:N-6 DNA methylase [Flavobacterium sp. ZT3R18]|uniref:class I SAM-dependent DNA methyltransferase n=1 Tax=Flavobacterium sp. ZT3R18 TaxID=2594429 RepID=UPI00163D7F47|nr:N-6 DNA methylase [Flavobacterium sp. ZT3R18]
MNITTIIRSIRDIMRKDSGVDGDAQRISQLVWMLFLKIFSDKEEMWKKENKSYISPINDKYKWNNWAHNNEMDPVELITFLNDDLFPNFKRLNIELNAQAKIVRSVFEDTYNFMKNGGLIKQVINEIDKIDFKKSENHHIFNEIYESILKELQSAGSSGEYYTPRAITQFMVDSINPKASDKILDPACGTGGFLTSAIRKIKLSSDKNDILINQSNFIGVEKKPLPHLLCTTNLMLHGFNEPAIFRDNFLSRPYDEWLEGDLVDVVLSNPPFGGIEEDGTEKNFPADYRTKETADLFLVLIIRLLKEKGRAAVVLPDNFLFGEGVRTRIKEKLLNECNLHTIVRLPKGVFSPYTSVKTNLLFFEKGKSTSDIWYFEHPYPNGQKSYSKSRPIKIEEFDLEKKWWNNRIETDYAWKVPIADIKKRNYNLDISSPYYSEEQLLSSSELRERLEKSLKKSSDLFSSLKLEF